MDGINRVRLGDTLVAVQKLLDGKVPRGRNAACGSVEQSKVSEELLSWE
jgi:hypothetical protein